MFLNVDNITIMPENSDKIIAENVTFSIEEEEVHALIGPNGSGKSSIAYAIMGLKPYIPVQGEIFFNGKNITKSSITERAKMGITLAWQEPVRFEGITIAEYLEIISKNREESARMLKLVNLNPNKYLDRKCDNTLSGGERKRVEIAAAVAMNPKLLILDEPDAGLDIIAYGELSSMLNQIKEETGASILIITHREETGEIADYASLMWDGRVIASGEFAEIMEKYCRMARGEKKCMIEPCPKILSKALKPSE